MDYTVLEGVDIAGLSTAVKNGMSSGWMPQGGVCYAESRYIQPMVKSSSSGGRRDRDRDRDGDWDRDRDVQRKRSRRRDRRD